MKKFLFCLCALVLGQAVFAATNNIVAITTQSAFFDSVNKKVGLKFNYCTGMRLSPTVIITAANCFSPKITNDIDLFLDLNYNEKAKVWEMTLAGTLNSGKFPNKKNVHLYLFQQNFNPEDTSGIEADRYGDLALLVIDNHENLAALGDINYLPQQDRESAKKYADEKQTAINTQYEKFLNVPLEDYKVLALNSKQDAMPEFFKNVKVSSYYFPVTENTEVRPVLKEITPKTHSSLTVNSGTFKGLAVRNPKILEWDMETYAEESVGAPVLDTNNKRLLGVVSGKDKDSTLESMKIDENVCSFLKDKAGIECEIVKEIAKYPTNTKKGFNMKIISLLVVGIGLLVACFLILKKRR